MVMTFKIAHSIGMDAANKSMRAAGRNVWNEEDANVAASVSYELFPPCAEGFVDVCECSRCKVAA